MTQVVAVESLEDWFRRSFAEARHNRKVEAAVPTEHYVVQLLTGFARSDQFYEYVDGSGYKLRPLASIMADAVEAPSLEERQQMLRRLGDLALFIAGFFAEYVYRRPVDMGYYSQMGETAYGMLSDLPATDMRGRALAEVFGELTAKFRQFVDVLNEMAHQARPEDERDLLRLYEQWLKSGSSRAAERLRALGLEPAEAARSRFIQ